MYNKWVGVLAVAVICTSLSVEGDKKSKNVKEKDRQMDPQKDVLVIGGGLAGLAAARKLTNHNNGQAYRVTILEARRDRYGGRVWTNRRNFPRARGLEAELGAHFLSSKFKDNPLLKIVNDVGLKTKSMGNFQLHVPAQNKVYTGSEMDKIFTEFLQALQSAVDKVKSEKVDRPIREALEAELTNRNTETDKNILMSMIDSHFDMSNTNFSASCYDVGKQYGSDTVLLDGFDQITDAIVGGFGMELPLIVDLRKIVRQIEMSKKKGKVLIRTRDLIQYEADIIVVALPIGVLQNKQVHFEPPLPKEWYKAMKNVGVGITNTVILEFDEVFWPKDVGNFMIVPTSPEDQGLFYHWSNAYATVGRPVLSGSLVGKAAEKMENMTDEEVKETAWRILTNYFGEEKVKGRNITRLIRSQWQNDIFSRGAVSYPKVGSTEETWKILEEPVCPHIYFAGEYTNFKLMNTAHGAYLSGEKAADQIISESCKIKMEEIKQKEKEKKARKGAKKDTKKKVDDDDDDDNDDDDDDEERKEKYVKKEKAEKKKNKSKKQKQKDKKDEL